MIVIAYTKLGRGGEEEEESKKTASQQTLVY